MGIIRKKISYGWGISARGCIMVGDYQEEDILWLGNISKGIYNGWGLSGSRYLMVGEYQEGDVEWLGNIRKGIHSGIHFRDKISVELANLGDIFTKI